MICEAGLASSLEDAMRQDLRACMDILVMRAFARAESLADEGMPVPPELRKLVWQLEDEYAPDEPPPDPAEIRRWWEQQHGGR